GLIEHEYRPRSSSLFVEIIVGVVRGVAVELVHLAMEALGAGLDDHGDGAAGADAVIGAVVAVQRLEFRDRVLRRQNHVAAAAAAIVQLAAVEQINVVGGAGAVEAEAVSGSQRIDAAEGWKAAGYAHAE